MIRICKSCIKLVQVAVGASRLKRLPQCDQLLLVTVKRKCAFGALGVLGLFGGTCRFFPVLRSIILLLCLVGTGSLLKYGLVSLTGIVQNCIFVEIPLGKVACIHLTHLIKRDLEAWGKIGL